MADAYCPRCGTGIDAVVEACPACGRYLPGTESYRRETLGKRKTAAWAIVIGLVIFTFGVLTEGGAKIINTSRGMSTAGTMKARFILVGLGLAGYGVFALYQSREDS